MRGQAGLFDVDERLKELSAKGDHLERLNALVDFELFRPDLSGFAQLAPRMLSSPARFRRGMPNTPSVGWATQACLARAVPRSDGAKGGRPPFDHVFMFKVLVLRHSLSDERTEFLIKDRLSFMRFLGLGLAACRPPWRGRTGASRRCAQPWSTCSRTRRGRWAWWCARSAWPAPA